MMRSLSCSASIWFKLISIQSVEIKQLPVEVLQVSLRLLPIQSLKKARLICKHWRAVGARYLFHRIYFTSRKEVIGLFLKIVDNEDFASNIEKMIYDSRLFTNRMYEVGRYSRRISSYFPNDTSEEDEAEDEDENEWKNQNDGAVSSISGHTTEPSTSNLPPHRLGAIMTADSIEDKSKLASSAENSLVDSVSEYSRLLCEQKTIFRFRRDLGALGAGLQRLSKLKRILVLDRFMGSLERPPILWDSFEFQWYQKWSAQLCEGTARPKRWLDADAEGRGIRISELDFRGIKHLLIALHEYAPQLRHLVLSAHHSRSSPAFYSLKEHVKILCKIASRLHSIELNCSKSKIESDLRTLTSFMITTTILKEADELQSLSLILDQRTANWLEMLLTIYWPHLTMLDLGNGSLMSHILRTVIQAHKDTLRQLRLYNVRLGDEYWEDLIEELGLSLQLRFISLSKLANPMDSISCFESDRILKTARLFLQQIPDHLLLVAKRESAGAVMTWHRLDFQPMFVACELDYDSSMYTDQIFDEQLLKSLFDSWYWRFGLIDSPQSEPARDLLHPAGSL